MKPLDMINEWRKGCSCAGPYFDKMMGYADGTTPASECIECTNGLIDALEKSLQTDESLLVADAN